MTQQETESSQPTHYRPMVQLTLTRLREFYREKGAIFWVYGFPLLMVIALGTAFRSRPADLYVVDVADGLHSKWISEVLENDSRFQVNSIESEQASQRLSSGKTSLIVDGGSSETIQFLYTYDPNAPAGLLSRNSTDDVLQRAAGRVNLIDTSDTVFEEPGGRYIDFLIPGMIGMGLMGGGLWGVGFAIVNLRMRNLLKRFLATPMKRTHFLMSVMLSRLLFMIPEILVIVIFSRIAFDVTCQGNYLSVFIIVLIGAIEFTGIGLLLGTRASTIESVSGMINLVTLPMWIGSGVFFGSDRFPEIVQPVLAILPLTPLIHALRSIMQEGASISTLGNDILIMSIWSVITFAIALKYFKWS